MSSNNYLPHENELYQKGLSALQRKNYDYAIDLFKELLNNTPYHIESLRQLLCAVRSKHNSSKPVFIDFIRKTLICYFFQLKSIFLIMIKKTLPAIRLQISILCLNPDDIPTLNRLARLFIHEEKLDNALAAFEEILVIDKNNIACLKNLSEIYFKTKNYKKALLMARLILKTKPHDLEAETILKDIAAITTIEKGFDEIKPAV